MLRTMDFTRLVRLVFFASVILGFAATAHGQTYYKRVTDVSQLQPGRKIAVKLALTNKFLSKTANADGTAKPCGYDGISGSRFSMLSAADRLTLEASSDPAYPWLLKSQAGGYLFAPTTSNGDPALNRQEVPTMAAQARIVINNASGLDSVSLRTDGKQSIYGYNDGSYAFFVGKNLASNYDARLVKLYVEDRSTLPLPGIPVVKVNDMAVEGESVTVSPEDFLSVSSTYASSISMTGDEVAQLPNPYFWNYRTTSTRVSRNFTFVATNETGQSGERSITVNVVPANGGDTPLFDFTRPEELKPSMAAGDTVGWKDCRSRGKAVMFAGATRDIALMGASGVALNEGAAFTFHDLLTDSVPRLALRGENLDKLVAKRGTYTCAADGSSATWEHGGAPKSQRVTFTAPEGGVTLSTIDIEQPATGPGAATGVSDAGQARTAPRYFDLTGREVRNPSHGIYIKSTPDSVSKVIF